MRAARANQSGDVMGQKTCKTMLKHLAELRGTAESSGNTVALSLDQLLL